MSTCSRGSPPSVWVQELDHVIKPGDTRLPLLNLLISPVFPVVEKAVSLIPTEASGRVKVQQAGGVSASSNSVTVSENPLSIRTRERKSCSDGAVSPQPRSRSHCLSVLLPQLPLTLQPLTSTTKPGQGCTAQILYNPSLSLLSVSLSADQQHEAKEESGDFLGEVRDS